MTLPVSPFRSLRFRLIASVVVIEVVMLSLLVWSNMGVIRQAYADQLQDTAGSILQQIATTSGRYLLEVDYASLEEFLGNIANREELEYLVVLDRDGRPVISFGAVPAGGWPEPEVAPLYVQDGVFDLVEYIRIGGRPVGVARMGFSLAMMEQAIGAARLRSIAIAVTEITLTILVTVVIGMHLTRRLGSLANAARRVGAGDYSVSVATEVPDEVGTTALAFNRMVTEVSERTRRLEETLARERVIEETSMDGMVTYGDDLRILSFNPAMTSLFGYSEQELLGQPVIQLLAAGQAPSGSPGDRSASHVWRQPLTHHLETDGVRKDGVVFPVELYIGHVTINGESLYAATLHDISERKRAERECMTLLEGNRFLIHKSLAVQEEERRHLARELHDELGQCMTAIQADAETIRDLSGGQQSKIAASAAAILDVSARIYGVVHSMMQRLRPSCLDDLGLVAAIEEEIGAWRLRNKAVELSLGIEGDVANLGEAVNISIYRIIQEGLTNIAKHADASRVDILLSGQDRAAGDHVRLKIEDNGVGVDMDQRNRGLGMIGMRERVEALGGDFTVRSAPGCGLGIDITIPLAVTEVA